MAATPPRRPTAAAPVRPKDSPVVMVKVGPAGKPLQRLDQSIRILELTYEDTVLKADSCQLTVDNFDLSNFVQDPNFRRGYEMEIQWGYAGNMSPPRKVIIRKITGGQQLKIEAVSRGILMHKERKRRRFAQMTRSQIVRQIAQENGYEGLNVDLEDTDEVLDVVVQPNLTDAEMIKRLAKQEGKEFFVDFTGLHWHKTRMAQKPIRQLYWYTPPEQGDILSFEIENDITGRPGIVTVMGFDPKKKARFSATGSNNATKRESTAKQVDTIDKITTTNDSNLVVETRPTPKATPKQGQVYADKRFAGAQKVNVKLKLDLVGDPSLVAKSVIAVGGIGPLVDGNFYVRACKHQIGSSGYKCSMETITDRGQANPTKGKTIPGQADPNKPQEVDQIVTGNASQGVVTAKVYRNAGGRAGGSSGR